MLTIHRSKGLEFPIVYCPYLWEPGYIPQEPSRSSFHDPTPATGARSTSASRAPDFDRHREQHVVEQRGEDLRLAYVALTRAQHQAVVWWAASWDSRDSALGRLLFARDADGNVAGRRPQHADGRRDAIAAVRASSRPTAPGCITVERSRLGLPVAWSGAPRGAGRASTAARFDRDARPRWRRTSYSDITAGAARGARGERAGGGAWSTTSPRRGRRPVGPRRSRRCLLGRDARRASRSARSCTRARGDRLRRRRPRRRAGGADRRGRRRGARSRSATPAAVVAGLRAAIETPLGPLARRRAAARRGARRPARRARLRAAAGRRRRAAGRARARRDRAPCCARTSPAGDPLAGYADRLDDRALRRERARLPDRQHRPRRARPATASRSSTTRRTGSARPARS